MKKFLSFIRIEFVPLILILGNICLIIVGFRIFNFEEGWIATMILLVCWLYGYFSCSEVCPFIKKLSVRLRKDSTT